MTTDRIFRQIIIVGMCCVVFAAGCAEQGQKPAVSPTQPKKPIQEAGKAVTQPAAKPGPSEAAQPAGVLSKDANGAAVAQITFKKLKYTSIVKNNTAVDFDSARQSDNGSPLAKLIGQSYTIAIEPNNCISSVSDTTSLMSSMDQQTPADRTGHNVVMPEVIKERHATLLLPQSGDKLLRPGDKWSVVKTFSFGLMGIKSYEKVYTLKEIRDSEGHKIAVIDMNAIPTSEMEEKYRSQKTMVDFPRMFDSRDMYTGSGEVDLTAGRIDSYKENLQTSWVAAMPTKSGAAEDANEPIVLRMTASRTYSIEKIK
jgi:hypothetical protein